MKKTILAIGVGFILGLAALPAAAQDDVRPAPSWVSDRGYWVVESNGDSCVVHFYNNDNQLVRQERMKGSLNTDRKRTKLWLTKELEQAVTAWEKRGKSGEERWMTVKGRRGE
ncbi:hypothetical protein Q4E93_29750 [Flavitalea sp. BT771]|uniref:hypothetical protein n=1 Tax=Flavitalea sp. BT771 TaxID=3063329 RepID=UPI0026E25450|nr:hypothetical protein [Flavitalea sp. BT771]MDO6434834.1 hypothetical protein [Flavitalea sp. BT771]MDV6223734.1 hypothetical protein [Flavitalea sp. BT771]